MSRADYWQHKLALYLHDPADKPFGIQGHELRAKEIADLLFQSTPDKNEYQIADWIASGLTRASLPGYSADETINGAVDFLKNSILTHPFVKSALEVNLVDGVSLEEIHKDIIKILKKDLGLGLEKSELDKLKNENKETAPLNAFFKGAKDDKGKEANEQWTKALYFYFFFALKKSLRNGNAGKIGGLWDLLPADTRIPDHSLWNHCALTSAIGSSSADDSDGEVSLAVFSISPVQSFISKARKLRDFWSGSVILSYLSFTGIKYIADTYGPDHIVYPSLHDQSLVETWLGRDFHLQQFLTEKNENIRHAVESGKTIASFPNKFVFLCSKSQASVICEEIEEIVKKEWIRIAALVREYLLEKNDNKDDVKKLFDHQISDYWQFSFATSKIAELDDVESLKLLLHESKWKNEEKTIRDFSKQYGKVSAKLYGATHTLIQSLLAAAKMKPTKVRKAQHGKKCPLCGEHEVLHNFKQTGKTEVREYNMAVKKYWKNIKGNDEQMKEEETMCAVCSVKRFLPMVIRKKNDKNEILYGVMDKLESFPSTTEVAAAEYLKKLEIKGMFNKIKKSEFVDMLHNLDEEKGEKNDLMRQAKEKGIKFSDRDKYYAVLLMDGDKMGDLINGNTVSAEWTDVLHPFLGDRFKDAKFCTDSVIRKYLNTKRILNPALHASVSEALNSFARFGVAPVVEKNGGRLIYAGGDDACAIMPLDTALTTANEIKKAYGMKFVKYTKNGAETLENNFDCSGKIGIHLGDSAGISISGAIVIAHHKEHLKDVLNDAHEVLEGIAKKRAGRNAIAIRLKKRSGGDRDIWMKWNEPNMFYLNETLLHSFESVINEVEKDMLSSSLIYRLSGLEAAVQPLAKDIKTNIDKILKLFAYEVGHSGKGSTKEKTLILAKRLAGLCIRCNSTEKNWFNSEAAIIARFLASPGKKEEEKND